MSAIDKFLSTCLIVRRPHIRGPTQTMSLSLTPNAVALWRNTFACQPGSVVPSQVREDPISKADDKNWRLARSAGGR
jgi:hypothetical protein